MFDVFRLPGGAVHAWTKFATWGQCLGFDPKYLLSMLQDSLWAAWISTPAPEDQKKLPKSSGVSDYRKVEEDGR